MTLLKTTFRSIFLCAALTAGVTAAMAAAAINVQQGAALQTQGALMVDVREPAEFAQGHAPGATLIPLGQLEQRLAELGSQKDRPIALICRSGNRSGVAQLMLEKAGFTKAVNVEGGMNAWTKAGLPVVLGAAEK